MVCAFVHQLFTTVSFANMAELIEMHAVLGVDTLSPRNRVLRRGWDPHVKGQFRGTFLGPL